MSNDDRSDEPGVGVLEPRALGGTGEEPKAMSKKFKKKDYKKQPWNVQIDVILNPGFPANANAFDIITTLPVGPDGNIKFENKHRPGFNIDFTLYDETGSNPPYQFPPQPLVREACWSKLGNTCPTSQCWEVFDPRHVDVSGTILRVYNDNPEPGLGDFKYTLRVTNDEGANYYPVDPGGTEMNGPRS